MIVVADASPLNYLILIDAIEILQRLYDRVLVPGTVVQELQNPRAPAGVRQWITRAPLWCEIQEDSSSDPELSFLDPGERAAIMLAVSVRADRLLIDDSAGRAEAKRRQLSVIGTVGVLAEAHLAGLLDFEQSLARLRATSFRLDPQIEDRLRRRLASEQEG
jgi:predicted nucleic acid-binding protein